jgi:RND family efflux transporter MFP subunit
MSSLEIEIDVNEAYINRVSPGQAAMATLDAWPDWKIPCHVIAIIPTADRQRATVGVRLGFNELDERILPDMGVKVAFQEAGEETAPTTVAPSGILLPPSALLNTGGQSYVFVVSDGRAERRAVATAGKRNNDVIVVSGLEPGEVIVIEGPSGLADGAGVQEKAR